MEMIRMPHTAGFAAAARVFKAEKLLIGWGRGGSGDTVKLVKVQFVIDGFVDKVGKAVIPVGEHFHICCNF